MVKAIYGQREVGQALRRLRALFGKAGIKVSGLYLYGSYARRQPRKYSDIDVAVISPDFSGKNRIQIQEQIAKALSGRTGSVCAVEAIGFSPCELSKSDQTTFLGEIKKTGIRIK